MIMQIFTIFLECSYKRSNPAKVISCSICDTAIIGPLLKVIETNFMISKGNIVIKYLVELSKFK